MGYRGALPVLSRLEEQKVYHWLRKRPGARVFAPRGGMVIFVFTLSDRTVRRETPETPAAEVHA